MISNLGFKAKCGENSDNSTEKHLQWDKTRIERQLIRRLQSDRLSWELMQRLKSEIIENRGNTWRM